MENAQPHKNDVLASNLLFGGLLLSTIVLFVRVVVLHKENPFLGTKLTGPKLIIFSWIVGYAFTIGIYYAIRLGKRWAKVLLLVVFVLGILLTIFRPAKLLLSLHEGPLEVINYVTGYLIYIWALFLMFRKPQLESDS